MAGEIDSGWIRLGVEAGAFLVSFGGLVTYVRVKLKSHDEDLAKHSGRLTNLESEVARGVRPQDIAEVNRRLDIIMQHLLKQPGQ